MKGNEAWLEQTAGSIGTVQDLRRYVEISAEEEREIIDAEKEFSWRVTPYYAGIMDAANRDCPIRMQAIPRREELDTDFGTIDPLHEESHLPAPNVIQVYPDRVAWTVSNSCPVLCRHCLRKRMVGRESFDFSREARDAALDYLSRTEEIRDVLITGGDPLMYPDDFVEELLTRLRAIRHVEIIRIGTRTPCTMPQRITARLCAMLARFHPLYVNTQFNHPRELTPEAGEACSRLADAGIPLGNQSVLLAGVNDDPEVMKALVRGLLAFRVRPYYLYQAQSLSGTAHFITPIEKGLEIIEALRGHTSGLAVPVYLLDTPYGKIPMNPQTIVGRDEDSVSLRAWNGRIWREPNRRTTADERELRTPRRGPPGGTESRP